MLGALLALIAAATFGLNNASVRRGVLSGSVLQALTITIPLGLVMFVVPALITGRISAVAEFSRTQVFFFISAGIVHFIFGRYCNYRAVRAMGANLAGGMLQMQIVVALVVALTFLGETLTILKSLGIALTFAGSAITLYPRTAPSAAAGAAPPKFTPNLVEGCIFGLLSALCYGVGPTLVRAGLAGTGESIAAGCVSYAAATVALFAFLAVATKQRRHVMALDRTAAPWFLLSGVAVNVSQFFVYLALAFAPVTVVVPIVQLFTIFRLIFAWFLTRDYEVFDLRIIIGIVLALVGTVLLTVEAEIIADLLQLGDGARAALGWSWP